MRFRGPVGPKGNLQKDTRGPPDDRRFRPVGKRAYPERPSGTRDSASAAASWCRLSAGENHVQVQTSFVVAASSGMDFAGEGAVRAHRPQTDCRCGRQTAPSSRYKPGELDGARGLYVAVPGRPAISRGDSGAGAGAAWTGRIGRILAEV